MILQAFKEYYAAKPANYSRRLRNEFASSVGAVIRDSCVTCPKKTKRLNQSYWNQFPVGAPTGLAIRVCKFFVPLYNDGFKRLREIISKKITSVKN